MTEPDPRDTLVSSHRGLVGHVVREATRWIGARADSAHLTSAGMAGLAAAARDYDADNGGPFAAYAAARVRGAVIGRLRGATAPTVNGRPAPSTQPWAGDGPPSALPDDPVTALRQPVAELPATHRSVLEEYFLAGRTMGEIATELDVTEDEACALRAEGLSLLTQFLRDQAPPGYRPA